jgi:hypothetical protein
MRVAPALQDPFTTPLGDIAGLVAVEDAPTPMEQASAVEIMDLVGLRGQPVAYRVDTDLHPGASHAGEESHE